MPNHDDLAPTHPKGFARAVALVAVLNLAYFTVEISAALELGSVSLFADGVDFLEDASINLIILLSLAASVTFQRRAGHLLAILMLAPALGALITAWSKLSHGGAPDPEILGVVGFGALAVNMLCALMLVRFRQHGSNLAKAAFLSARNDVFANLAIITAAALTMRYPSFWPDLLVGLGIFAMNASAAQEVWAASSASVANAPKP